jgi:iron complex outermembrane recepter protein
MSFESSRQLRAKTLLGVCPLFAPNRSLRFCDTPTLHSALLQNLLRGRGVFMRVCVALSLSLLLVGLCSAQTSHAAIRKDLNVPPEDLSPALQQVATTYEIQLLYPTPLTKDLKTHGAVGSLTADDALTKVLSGTGLSYKYLDANTVTVFATAAPAAAAQDQTNQTQDKSQEAGKKSSQDFHVAQVDQGQTPGPTTVEKEGEQSSKKKPVLEEVVVTGSRIPLAAGEQQVQPIRSYTLDDIQQSGQTTIGDFLNTLPSVSTFKVSTFDIGYAGLQSVQLHGLPVGTTLTLLDGQRVENSTLGFFDLSSIPVTAVERIEVLPVGASAIYGADALAGAVNFVLRKNFDGFEINGNVSHGVGVTDDGANLAWGKTWDRGSVSLIGTYLEQGELSGAQREPTDSTIFPGNPAALSALGATDCVPGNVYSVDGSNLPGLSSPYAAIPAGITGTPTIAQFAAAAGKQNICNPTRFQDLVPFSQREGALLSARYDVTDSVELFTDLLFSHRDLRISIGPQVEVQPYFGPLGATNPYNPFGVPVNVSFSYPGSGTPETQSASLIHPLVGIRGALFSDWHYEATAYLSKSQFHDVSLEENYQVVTNALSSSNPATALNPFTSGPPGTPQLMSEITNPTGDYVTNETDQIVEGQGILRGSAGHIPAGDIQTVIGSEYRREKEDNDAAYVTAPVAPLLLSRTSYSAFGEMRAPLIGGDWDSTGKERLALTLAGRYDHSNDYGGARTWQSGLIWHAVDGFSFRGGYGTSYEAPQLNQIAGPQSSIVFAPAVVDPFQGNTVVDYPVTQVYGPNFHLKPETGSSTELGFDYSSTALTGFQTSVTWYDIKITNYIGLPAEQTLVSDPGLYPGAVIRAPPTPQEQQEGYLGAITQINQTYYNYGDVRVTGFDADIRYAIESRFGRFTPSVAISNIYRWQSALLPGLPPIDGVSQATFAGIGWAPRWKGTAVVAWKKGPVSANIAGRYIGPYRDYQDAFPNSNELGNTWIFDVNGRYEVGDTLGSQSKWVQRAYVTIGAVNVLNKVPPFSYTGTWYDWHEYDARGRFVFLNVGTRL